VTGEGLDIVLVVEPGTPRAHVDQAFRGAGALPDPAVASSPAFAGWLLYDLLPATLEVWPIAGVFALDVSLWPPAARQALADRLPLVDPRRAEALLQHEDPRWVALGARLLEATAQVDRVEAVLRATQRSLPGEVYAEVAEVAESLQRARQARAQLQQQLGTLMQLLRRSLQGQGAPVRPATAEDAEVLFVPELLPGPVRLPAPAPAPTEPFTLSPAGLLRRPPPVGPAVALPWRNLACVLVPGRVWAIPPRLEGAALAWSGGAWVIWPTPWASLGPPLGSAP
jgi:hypothetical protein